MADHSVDVVVLGMGPGGDDLAGTLAEAGLSVVGVDHRLVGGECPYWGCVPTKMMVRAGGLIAEVGRAPELAGPTTIAPSWDIVAARIRDGATDDWDDRVAVERFEAKGGRFVRGTGTLDGPRRVRVGDDVFSARVGVVLNTGTEPVVPPIPGLADVAYWTSRDAVEASSLPRSLLVLGGGAIGCEFAQVFSRFGVEVTVLEAAPHLLPGDEPEAGALLASVFDAAGIGVHVGCAATDVSSAGGTISVATGGGAGTLRAERLLVATGRRADLAQLNLASAGIDIGPRTAFVEVDTRLRAGDGLWAIGDCTGKGAFTHVSMYQARLVAADILGTPVTEAEYHAVPRVTFTDPEVGAVGLTEAAARERGVRVATGRADVAASSRGWIHKTGNEGFIKLVADRDRDILVGATSVGPSGGEVLGLLALAVHARVELTRRRTMIYAYPTFHRAVETAVNDLA